MNCQQFDQLIVRLSCDQLADPGEARRHAQHCVSCGARLARQRDIAAGLQTLAADEHTIQAPAHLAAVLQAAFAQQMQAQKTVVPKPTWLQWLNWRLAAAALVIGVALALVWWRPRQTERLADKRAGVNAPAKPQETPPPLEAPKQNALAQATAFKSKPHSRSTLKGSSRKTEEYGALLSLTPLAHSEPDEFQQVARMQIPRATLRLWGVPLNEESNSAQVSAEVVFGEDGVARAIRLRN